MKHKLKEYIDTIFADAEARTPGNRDLRELKEEMLQNLYEKYDDLLAAGRTPAAAYNIAVASVGDISGLLDSVSGAPQDRATEAIGDEAPVPPAKGRRARVVRPPLTPAEEETVRRYRERSAVLTSVAIALYILCVTPTFFFGNGWGELVMFIMVAVATAMLIFNAKTRPKIGGVTWKDDDDSDDDDNDDRPAVKTDRQNVRPPRSPVYTAISGALWILTVCAYLIVSFATAAWYITWMMFLIAVAVDNIIKAIFDLRR